MSNKNDVHTRRKGTGKNALRPAAGTAATFSETTLKIYKSGFLLYFFAAIVAVAAVAVAARS